MKTNGKPPYPDLHRQLIEAGFGFKMGGSGHWKYQLGTKMIVISGSPSDKRAYKNIKSQIKRVLV